MIDVGAICEGLAAVVSSVGLTCHPTEPDQIVAPEAWVTLGDDGEPFMVNPWETFRGGSCQMRFTVRLCASTSAGGSLGVRSLWPFLGSGDNTQSVIDAIQGDTTLRGALPVGNLRVDNIGAPRSALSASGAELVVVDVPVTVYGSRV